MSAIQLLLDVEYIIVSLPDDAFKNNATNRKKALSNKISYVLDTLELAKSETDPIIQDEMYDEVINKLQNDILEKMDGYLGGNEKNDWIIDCDAQIELNELIDEIVSIIIELKN